jgi:phage/plasmid-associated DNA primase
MIFTEGQGKINFENGTLDLSTMTLFPFRREDYLTYCLSYCYAPGTHPLINQFLKETIPDVHARQAYMAHIGLALMQDSSLHFVLLLLGPTRAGKSTLLAIANAACGTSPLDNYAEDFSFAGPSLFSRELEGKRSRYRWVYRRIVCADEIPAEALRDEELFKTMSAHGGVEMRGMHKDEDTSNRWRPKMILAANDRPRYKDVAGAVKERCIFISCPNHRLRGERDPQLFAKLRSEIGAFAATCIELARRVLARGYYPMSYAMKHMTDVIARDGNHVKAFVAECCITGVAEDWSVSENIYGAYLSYCANNGHKSPLPKNVLSSTICNMGIGVSAKRGRSEGKVVCGLQGIRLRVEQDPWMTEEEERSRYVDDVLLIGSTEMLMAGERPVAGCLQSQQQDERAWRAGARGGVDSVDGCSRKYSCRGDLPP